MFSTLFIHALLQVYGLQSRRQHHHFLHCELTEPMQYLRSFTTQASESAQCSSFEAVASTCMSKEVAVVRGSLEIPACDSKQEAQLHVGGDYLND